jgi:hypothetical protein
VSEQTKKIEPEVGATYRHFKGRNYRVRGIATLESNLNRQLVIYAPVYANGYEGEWWAREVESFLGCIEGRRADGQVGELETQVPRFKKIVEPEHPLREMAKRYVEVTQMDVRLTTERCWTYSAPDDTVTLVFDDVFGVYWDEKGFWHYDEQHHEGGGDEPPYVEFSQLGTFTSPEVCIQEVLQRLFFRRLALAAAVEKAAAEVAPITEV